MPGSCLKEEMMRDYLADLLDEEKADAAAVHLANCAECTERLNRLSGDSNVRRAFKLYHSEANTETCDLPLLESLRAQICRLQPKGELTEADEGLKSPDSTLAPGTRVAHFELVRLLGTGGFANVYLATDTLLDRLVALKIPRGSTRLDPRIRIDHQNEGRSAARLHHPNIIAVHEVGEVEGHEFIAADYCEGPTLAAWYQSQDGPVPCRMAAQIVLRLAGAIGHAHLNGLIHRDVKPANVLLDPNQADIELPFSPKLTDFGLARWIESDNTHTATGVLKGTPRYMAPEQAQGMPDKIGPGCDIYSLGALLYELLTGKVPIEGESQVDTLRRLVADAPVAPRRIVRAISRDLEAITLKCLEKSPSRRYASAEVLADDLNRYLTGRPTIARPLNPLQRFSRWARFNPTIAGATVISILILTISAVVLIFNNRRLDGLNIQLQAMNRSQAELLYAADVQTAARAMEAGDLRQAYELLDRYIPAPGQPDLRGFEWSLLRHSGLRPEVTLSGHTGGVYAVQYSPDGHFLASTGEDGTVRLHETSEYRLLTSLQVTEREVNGIGFAPDSRRFATADDDGNVCIFDINTQQQILQIKAHDGLAFQVAFTPDGGSFFTCGNDRIVKRWNADTGEFLETLGTHARTLEGISLSADGRFLASACNDGGYVWETDTGRLVGEYRPGTGMNMNSVSFSPEGVVAWATLRRGCLLDKILEDGTLARIHSDTSYHDPVQSVGFSRDGRWRAAGDQGGVLRIRAASPLRQTGRISEETTTLPGNDLLAALEPTIWEAHSGKIWCVEFAPNCQQLATAGADGTVRIWPIETARLDDAGFRYILEGKSHDFAVLDDRKLVTAGSDSVSVWDLSGEKPSHTELDESGEWRRVAVPSSKKPASQVVVAGNDQGILRSWNLQTRERSAEWADPEGRDVSWLGSSPDSSLLIAKLDGNLLAFQLPDLQLKDALPDVWCNAVAISPSGERLAVANRGKDTIDLWNLSTRQIEMTLTGHTSTVNTLAFSPDGLLLASGSNDRSVRLWDVRSGQMVAELREHRAPVQSVGFSPDGQRLLTSSGDCLTQIWSLPSGRHLLSIGQSIDGLNPECSAVLASDGTWLTRLINSTIEIHDLKRNPADPVGR